MKQHLTTGQITLMIAIIGGLSALLASGVSAWAVSGSRIADVEAQISVVETTEQLHYRELKEDTEEIKSDIKEILKALQ